MFFAVEAYFVMKLVQNYIIYNSGLLIAVAKSGGYKTRLRGQINTSCRLA